MAHYAILDENNIVIDVIVGHDEDQVIDGISDWEKHYEEVLGKKCKRTSYNTKEGIHYDAETNLPSSDQSKAFRKNYASIGSTYDEERDAFIPIKIYESWVLNEGSCSWESPIPYPEDERLYAWNEQEQRWYPIFSPKNG